MNITSILMTSGALALGLCVSDASAQAAGQSAAAHPVAPKGSSVVATTSSDPSLHTAPETPARASKLIGLNIVDAAGKDIAEIKDLMVADSGEVVACVEREDDLYFCVPMSMLEARLTKSDEPEARAKAQAEASMSGATPDIKQFTLKGDRALFDSVPTVKDAKMVDRECMKHSMDHFAGRPMAAPKGEADSKDSKAMPGHEAMMAATKPCSVKTLLGSKVKGSGGDDVGDVQDLAIDLRGNLVAYAIVSTGGVLGVGDKLHAVAFDRLTWSDGTITIPMTGDSVSKLPDLDMDRLPVNLTSAKPAAKADASDEHAADRKRG